MFFLAMRRIVWQLYRPRKRTPVSEFSLAITITTMKRLLTQLALRL